MQEPEIRLELHETELISPHAIEVCRKNEMDILYFVHSDYFRGGIS